MIVTVFRSRLQPGAETEYLEWIARMSALAKTMPGYISHKAFVAQDGERVTIVEFESAEQQQVWATHPEHLAAMKKGRTSFYSEYQLQICTVERTRSHKIQ